MLLSASDHHWFRLSGRSRKRNLAGGQRNHPYIQLACLSSRCHISVGSRIATLICCAESLLVFTGLRLLLHLFHRRQRCHGCFAAEPETFGTVWNRSPALPLVLWRFTNASVCHDQRAPKDARICSISFQTQHFLFRGHQHATHGAEARGTQGQRILVWSCGIVTWIRSCLSRLAFSRSVKYHLHSGCMRSPCLQCFCACSKKNTPLCN